MKKIQPGNNEMIKWEIIYWYTIWNNKKEMLCQGEKWITPQTVLLSFFDQKWLL